MNIDFETSLSRSVFSKKKTFYASELVSEIQNIGPLENLPAAEDFVSTYLSDLAWLGLLWKHSGGGYEVRLPLH